MRYFIPCLAALLLCACGVDAVSTAAVTATATVKEVKQGNKKMDTIQPSVDAAYDDAKRNRDAAEEAALR